MLDNATFDTRVAGFYRAATGEIGWDSALDGVQAAFGARCDPAVDRPHKRAHVEPARRWAPTSAKRCSRTPASSLRDRPAAPASRWAAGRSNWGNGSTATICSTTHSSPGTASSSTGLPAYGTRYNSNVIFGLREGVINGFILEPRRPRLTHCRRTRDPHAASASRTCEVCWRTNSAAHRRAGHRRHGRCRRPASGCGCSTASAMCLRQ